MHCCLWPLTFFTSLFSFFHLAHRSYKYFDVNIDVYIMDTNVCVHSYLEVGFDLFQLFLLFMLLIFCTVQSLSHI